ncbi:MAG: hypothetical protein IE916_04360 [Epsilonproteobacteria bacterium]|nr:hypothetical protein [Campylobacterota bacterium]
MCYSETIEVEDRSFSSFLHHYDEFELDLNYNDIYGCIESIATCIEEYVW